MQLFLSVVIGVLFFGGTFLILQRSLIRILFGFGLLTHAGNVLLLSMSGNPSGKVAPIVSAGLSNVVDPIPQALILTAIVIGFGITAFVIVLFYKIISVKKTTHVGEIYGD